MKKVKQNKLSLNKQTVTTLSSIKGGFTATLTMPTINNYYTCAITCGRTCNYTCNQSDGCATGASKCYCG